MSKRPVIEILRAARERIENPRHWCRGQFAKDAHRFKVNADSKSAVRWCAIGALRAEGDRGRAKQLLEQSLGETATSVVRLNDNAGRTRRESHREVLALYDRAIERAERL